MDIILQRTNTNDTKPKVAELENIGANYLGFVKSLLQQYSQQLGLNSNHYPAESAFNFYINDKITECLGGTVNIEAVKEEYKYQQQHQKEYNFGTATPWELSEEEEEEEEEEESEDQEFTYQNPITENPENNPNPELINQQNLPPVIVIDQPPINSIAEPIQQPLQLPPQQPVQQQLLQQPPQLPNLDPIAYVPIAKLDNFTGKEDDAQAITANGWNDARAMQAILYFLKDTANSWYQSLVNKPQDFNAFKAEFLRYFSNNNSINCLVNTFTTMKQGETEAVTTYLGCFHRNLCQIQAIDANYFTAPQILN
ncbi:hypothetical protein G9A89_014400 [Geosiphon pyriformis]|nr:hypothetical protein G9A89_014400 [Geosiphon pyriformis]